MSGEVETRDGGTANSFTVLLGNLLMNLALIGDGKAELVLQADGSGRIQAWHGGWFIGFNRLEDAVVYLNKLEAKKCLTTH